eukprot:CAMPEP_0183430354 /NCGR_PEP_ID=MMETSP0370-20130417/50922_1 /TAXON_ID=268820 /ORGANISM="Peridinium aciculiferum, Strain PAER-2" /LENGTH=77 /DNA_ID=CAMNT_0025615679 /DNA_START=72 /DNA_END=305 /DNA_ORIENTATION=+
MARGLQAVQSQKKAQEKAAAASKAGGTTPEQRKAKESGNKVQCTVCLAPMSNYKCLKEHYEAKHPKATCPTEESLAV